MRTNPPWRHRFSDAGFAQQGQRWAFFQFDQLAKRARAEDGIRRITQKAAIRKV